MFPKVFNLEQKQKSVAFDFFFEFKRKSVSEKYEMLLVGERKKIKIRIFS